MWPNIFDDRETRASFDRLRGRYDERMAFMVASVDAAFRKRVKAGDKPLEAYARSAAEIANMNALVEGFSPDVARKHKERVYAKTLREGLDDPVHPHTTRFLPTG